MPMQQTVDTADPWVSDYQAADKTAQNPAAAASAAQPAAATSYDAAWSSSPATSDLGAPKDQTTQPVGGSKATSVVDNLGVSPTATSSDPSLKVQMPANNSGVTGGLGVLTGVLPGDQFDPRTTDYTTQVQAVQAATNPQDYLVKQDQLARSVATDLQAAGHDVSWQGSQLMVDGRPYEVGGQQWGGSTGAAMAAPNSGESASAYAFRLIQGGMDPQQATTQANSAFGLQEGQDGWGKNYGDGTIGFHDAYLYQQPDGSWGIQQRPDGGAVTASASGGGISAPSIPTSNPVAPYVPGATPDYASMWSPSATDTYVPGQIGNEGMPDFTYESLLQDAQSGNPVEAGTDSLVNELLAHPESLDAHTVEMMKAQDAEEQQQANLSEDQASRRYGFQAGLTDSPWLASERASNARTADANIISDRRNIELKAADTNMSDRRAAAAIGVQYQGQRAAQKQAAVNLAVSGSIAKAAETRNRFQLNEDLKEKAAELSISKDKLIQDYVTSSVADLTKRYGVDVGAGIDTAKLSEQSDEFKADLLFRLQSLAQQNDQFGRSLDQNDRQFGANLGFNYDQLNQNALNQYWNQTGA